MKGGWTIVMGEMQAGEVTEGVGEAAVGCVRLRTSVVLSSGSSMLFLGARHLPAFSHFASVGGGLNRAPPQAPALGLADESIAFICLQGPVQGWACDPNHISEHQWNWLSELFP